MKEVVIFDTEYTTWEGALERNWDREGEYREIVQIAAVRIDAETFERIGPTLDTLVKPKINPEVSEFFTELTSISNDALETRGIDFLPAAKRFRAFSKDATLYSFGDDCAIMNENIGLYNLQDELPKFEGVNLHEWRKQIGIELTPLADGRPFTSGTFAEAVGAPFKTEAHYALNDVLSIQAAVQYLVEEKGHPNPFTS